MIGNNLGNRLQNYALQCVLENLGMNVVTSSIVAPKRPLLRYLKTTLMSFRNKTTDDRFMRFNKKIHWKNDSMSHMHDDPEIDFYIAGSDQIWNPYFSANSEREFLTFALPHKRIAYAASMGVDELPLKCIKDYTKYLDGIPFISVREESGAKIIKKLIGRDVPVVLDPTLLIDKKNWKTIADSSNITHEKPYIFTYFLGIKNNKYNLHIKQKAKLHNMKIISAVGGDDGRTPIIGPADFINLLSHATYVYTDSYHAVIFSIIFNKNFVIFDRPAELGYGDMSSRFETIFNLTGLKSQWIRSESQLNSSMEEINYSDTNLRIMKKSDESIAFLRKALRLNIY